jgi:MFS transporter, FHS family, L-fucose permease
MASFANTTTANIQIEEGKSYTLPLTILTSLFFIWGFITCMNDILIPHLKSVFHLNYTQAMLIQFTFFGAYFLMSLPSGKIISKFGYKNGIIIGLVTAATGCLLFYPAAETKMYGFFLAALFILASGITLLQVAANPYVAILGNPATASSRLNLTQAFNSLGTALAPTFGALVIFSGATYTALQLSELPADQALAYNLSQADAVKLPYIGLALALLILAIIIKISNLPVIESGNTEESSGSFKGAWKNRHLALGVICIFMYVGGEISIGSFLINFLNEPSIAGLTEEEASSYVSIFWTGAMVGRFAGVFVLNKIDPGKVLGFCGAVVVLLILVVVYSSGDVAKWAIVSIGLFNSIMFPTIFTLAIKGLGINTGQGSSLLIMAIVGGAVVPLAQGALADAIGIQSAFLIQVVCYSYVFYYGFFGSRPTTELTEDNNTTRAAVSH